MHRRCKDCHPRHDFADEPENERYPERGHAKPDRKRTHTHDRAGSNHAWDTLHRSSDCGAEGMRGRYGIRGLNECAGDGSTDGDASHAELHADEECGQVGGARDAGEHQLLTGAVSGLHDTVIQSLQGLHDTDRGQCHDDRDGRFPTLAEHDADEIRRGHHETDHRRQNDAEHDPVDSDPCRQHPFTI